MNWIISLSHNLPVLLVLPPLIAAPVVMFVRSQKAIFAICFTSALIAFCAAVVTISITAAGNVIAYDLGDSLHLEESNIVSTDSADL